MKIQRNYKVNELTVYGGSFVNGEVKATKVAEGFLYVGRKMTDAQIKAQFKDELEEYPLFFKEDKNVTFRLTTDWEELKSISEVERLDDKEEDAEEIETLHSEDAEIQE